MAATVELIVVVAAAVYTVIAVAADVQQVVDTNCVRAVVADGTTASPDGAKSRKAGSVETMRTWLHPVTRKALRAAAVCVALLAAET